VIRDKFQSSLPRLVSPTLELICALVWGMVCGAQEPYLERGDRVNGWKTRQGFEALYQDHRASVVEILDGGHQVALGTVVSDSGHIITKASELGSDLEIRDHQGQRHVPFSIQVDPEIDLAILQIRSSSLRPVRWGDDSQVAMGLWVMAPHEDESQVRVGVISTSAREVKRKPGALGIVFFSDRRQRDTPSSALGARINRVVEGGAADKAGIKEGDVIVQIDGKPVQRSEEVIELIQQHEAGETIGLIIIRGEEEMSMQASLGFFDATFPEQDLNITLSGDISKRRTGFGLILQHDMPLPPKAMGGPLMQFSGEVIGINISRYDRVATLAIPASRVRALLEASP